jgi:hypothetical protein
VIWANDLFQVILFLISHLNISNQQTESNPSTSTGALATGSVAASSHFPVIEPEGRNELQISQCSLIHSSQHSFELTVGEGINIEMELNCETNFIMLSKPL